MLELYILHGVTISEFWLYDNHGCQHLEHSRDSLFAFYTDLGLMMKQEPASLLRSFSYTVSVRQTTHIVQTAKVISCRFDRF